jgi:hypothetical protein
MNFQPPTGQSPAPADRKQWAPSATDQQDFQDPNGSNSMQKKQKQ